MKLMDIDSEQLGIPDTDYDATISLPSAEFAKIMRDLKDLGESVRIEATAEGVKFTAEGEIGTGSVTVKPTGEYRDAAKKKAAAKPKVKAEKKSKREPGSDDEAMDEDDEDVKPEVKDESDDDNDEQDEDEDDSDANENEDSEDEAPQDAKSKKGKGKGKGAAAKTNGKKAAGGKKAKDADGEENRNVMISVNQTVSLNFSIKYLNNFAKSTPLSTEVILKMSNDVPLLVSAILLCHNLVLIHGPACVSKNRSSINGKQVPSSSTSRQRVSRARLLSRAESIAHAD